MTLCRVGSTRVSGGICVLFLRVGPNWSLDDHGYPGPSHHNKRSPELSYNHHVKTTHQTVAMKSPINNTQPDIIALPMMYLFRMGRYAVWTSITDTVGSQHTICSTPSRGTVRRSRHARKSAQRLSSPVQVNENPQHRFPTIMDARVYLISFLRHQDARSQSWHHT